MEYFQLELCVTHVIVNYSSIKSEFHSIISQNCTYNNLNWLDQKKIESGEIEQVTKRADIFLGISSLVAQFSHHILAYIIPIAKIFAQKISCKDTLNNCD